MSKGVSSTMSYVQVQQHAIRHMRTLAYPKYTPQNVPKPRSKKDHTSYFNRAIKGFLGPKNVTGEYFRNAYFYPSQQHRPNYIIPNGQSVVDSSYRGEGMPAPRRLVGPQRNPHLHPFPQNTACQTAYVISHDMKRKIVADIDGGLSSQQVAQKYGIKMARVEAIVILNKIESNWSETNKISPDLKKFSDVMYKMFPVMQTSVQDNLTEIPTPHKTLQQRLLTIAESEPFGPVEAAKILDLPVAADTLTKLAEEHVGESHKNTRKNTVVLGAAKAGDRVEFKFTQRKSGDVGFRYGASRRDRRKDRSVAFDAEGKMVYV